VRASLLLAPSTFRFIYQLARLQITLEFALPIYSLMIP
jgi:hypothetical protein